MARPRPSRARCREGTDRGGAIALPRRDHAATAAPPRRVSLPPHRVDEGPPGPSSSTPRNETSPCSATRRRALNSPGVSGAQRDSALACARVMPSTATRVPAATEPCAGCSSEVAGRRDAVARLNITQTPRSGIAVLPGPRHRRPLSPMDPCGQRLRYVSNSY
jgi:hypothetical protein